MSLRAISERPATFAPDARSGRISTALADGPKTPPSPWRSERLPCNSLGLRSRPDFELSRGGRARGCEQVVGAPTSLLANEPSEAVSSRCYHAVQQRGGPRQAVSQSTQHPSRPQHAQHIRGSSTSRATTAVVAHDMSPTKTFARDDVYQQLTTERRLNRHRHEHMAMVALHGPSHRPATKATVCVVQNDHEHLQAKQSNGHARPTIRRRHPTSPGAAA